MNVVSPDTDKHIIKIIPRYYPTGEITLSFFNETLQVTEVVENSYNVRDGNMFVSFDYEFVENQKFQVKIEEENEVVYRGKLIATSQNPQEYKLTNNVYYY